MEETGATNNQSQAQKGNVDEKEEKNKLMINALKIKISQLEKEKSDKNEKYSKLINDYATCAQEKRDAWAKIRELEKEIEELRELLKQKPTMIPIIEDKIPIAHTHDHSEKSPVAVPHLYNEIDSQ